MKGFKWIFLCFFPMSFAFSEVQDCGSIKNKDKRLACYDSKQNKKPSEEIKQKDVVSAECKNYEKMSNAMLGRFEVGIDSPTSYQGPLGDLVASFNECVYAPNITDNTKLDKYRINIAAFKLFMEYWRQGIDSCRAADLQMRQMGLSGFSNCKWQSMPPGGDSYLEKNIQREYPEITKNVSGKRYGEVTKAAFDQIVRFQ